MVLSDALIRGMPKAELHMHLEGSIEAEQLLAIAERNGLRPRWETPEALRAAYRFRNLQAFLDLYYEGCRVLLNERDFHDITRAYLRRAHDDAVVRAEVFIGPQSFTERGVAVDAVMEGVLTAMRDAARDDGISAGLLVSAQRHRSEAEALRLLGQVMPWADQIAGFGLGGAEVGNPPSRFAGYFRACRERDFRITVHAGEEGPASYVREAIEVLEVDRIDHGVACMDDPVLVRELAARGTPLTVCPLSNLRLNVVASLPAHPLRKMLEAGLNVTMNSDDPAYFGGTVNDNFIACHDALALSDEQIAALARNSLRACFLPPADIAAHLARLDAYLADSQSSAAPRT
ncbi:MAG TPA: adenosine deaminase [Acetobacteraceae bacterium]